MFALFGEGDALEQIEIYDVPKSREGWSLVSAVVDFPLPVSVQSCHE